jgi:hypothetical protein
LFNRRNLFQRHAQGDHISRVPLPELKVANRALQTRTLASCAQALQHRGILDESLDSYQRQRVSSTMASGCENQSRNRRAPISVTVRFTTP